MPCRETRQNLNYRFIALCHASWQKSFFFTLCNLLFLCASVVFSSAPSKMLVERMVVWLLRDLRHQFAIQKMVLFV